MKFLLQGGTRWALALAAAGMVGLAGDTKPRSTALESLPLTATVRLAGETHHVQGIDVHGPHFFVTAVDRARATGRLSIFEAASGAFVRAIDLRDGPRYHPGGLSGDDESVWIPLAEYRPRSSSVIEQRNRRTLALERRFPVPDHIGCIAVGGPQLVGANWDSRDLYFWDRSGKLIRKTPNPTGNAFQDLKYVDGYLVGSGLLADKSGAIDWLELPSLRTVRRITAGKTDRGAVFTQEGMAIARGRIYLLPEDTPSRVFVFRLPK